MAGVTLREYFVGAPVGSKSKFAKRLGISKTWLSLLISEREVPSAEMALMIEQATMGRVTRVVLRPDLFGEIQ